MVWRRRITITWWPDYLNCLFSWILGLFFVVFLRKGRISDCKLHVFFLACRNGVGHIDWSHRGGRWKVVTHWCLRSKFSQRPNLNASDIRGKTALIFASSYGHREARLEPSLWIFLVGWIGWLGASKIMGEVWGDVVVKETGASNAPGWGEIFREFMIQLVSLPNKNPRNLAAMMTRLPEKKNDQVEDWWFGGKLWI